MLLKNKLENSYIKVMSQATDLSIIIHRFYYFLQYTATPTMNTVYALRLTLYVCKK